MGCTVSFGLCIESISTLGEPELKSTRKWPSSGIMKSAASVESTPTAMIKMMMRIDLDPMVADVG